MKKIVLAAVFAALISAVFAENIQNEILGVWDVETFLIVNNDGLIVVPEAAYSHPYLGITGINFIDDSFVVFTVMDVKYRAFYEFESVDFDNYHIKCQFKGGEEFLLKIARTPDARWKYFYQIAEDSVLTGLQEKVEKPVAETEAHMTEVDSPEAAEAEVVFSTYTGTMVRRR